MNKSVAVAEAERLALKVLKRQASSLLFFNEQNNKKERKKENKKELEKLLVEMTQLPTTDKEILCNSTLLNEMRCVLNFFKINLSLPVYVQPTC